MNFKIAILALTSLTLVSCGEEKGSGSFSDSQKKDIQKIVADYLESNPDVVGKALSAKPDMILEAIKKLGAQKEEKDKAKAKEALVKNKDDVFNDTKSPSIGNPDGKKVFVEFFDYNCPHCREMNDVMKKLVAEDKDIKVIYKLWPMFGKDSLYAARAAMAAKAQGKFSEIHDLFMGSPDKLDEKKILEIAKGLGLDMTKFAKDIDDADIKAHLETIRTLADKLEIAGAPYIIYGDEAIPGRVELEELKAMMNKKADTSKK